MKIYIDKITSSQNPKIKKLIQLQEKSRIRRQEGLFVVEGRRETGHCLKAGFDVQSIFCLEEMTPAVEDLLRSGSAGNGSRTGIFEVRTDVYSKIAYREGTEGIIAVVRERKLHLEELDLGSNPLIVVLESVEKPGNLGAVLRSADAAGADAVLVCDPLTDLFNPNTIRASLGGIFSVPTVVCSSEEAISFLKKRGIQILSAQLQDSSLYYNTDMKRATAIVMGTESTGLSDIWREAANKHILIPMLGELDSLNVSVSAAILLFEAVRQRSRV